MSRFGIEDSTTEFKVELTDNLEKEVVAFLNSAKGGDIYIGVDDSGHAVGVENADALMLAVSDRIKNNILPTCLGLYDVYPEEHDGLTVLHVVISRGTEKPYYLRRYGQSPAGCYIRVGSGVQQMTVAMIDQLYASRVRNSLRNIPSPANCKLTFQQLKIYYQEKGFQVNDSFLNNLDLYAPDGQLNYAAYLLADENSVSIKVAKYAGTDKCDLIENEEYGFCSLAKATHQVLDKLNIENKTLTRITGAAEREQHRMVNERALREALINAMVHNDYSSEVPPVVEIFSDRISITSYGGLVAGLSKEECLAGRSMPRNRELMRVFRDLELVEQLGSGMHRILSIYSSDIFRISKNFFEICFERADVSDATPTVPPTVTPTVTPTVERLILAFTGDMSRDTLQKTLELKDKMNFIREYLKPALAEGLIEMTIPEKPNSRLQKYRLTPAGLKVQQGLGIDI